MHIGIKRVSQNLASGHVGGKIVLESSEAIA